MRSYRRGASHLFCGHWNGSPVEIGVTSVLTAVPRSEVLHAHDYHEYYVVLEGRAALLVEGETTPLEAGTVVMVEPGEKHRVSWVDPNAGVRWMIIKQRSEPDSKRIFEEPGPGARRYCSRSAS